MSLEPIPFAGMIETEETMTTNELIEALDQRYGNPYAKECALIHQAIAEMRLMQAELDALRAQVNEN
jgi:hypothetical protein